MKTDTYNKSTVWFLSTPILLSYFTKVATIRGLCPDGLFLFSITPLWLFSCPTCGDKLQLSIIHQLFDYSIKTQYY
ncbi:hypothetical protein ACFQ5D_09745, partial [Paenibacillus farraposensis]